MFFCFNDIYECPRRSKWVSLIQQMNVVWFSVYFKKNETLLAKNTTDCAIDSFLYRTYQNRVSVFCHQNHMILKQKTAVFVCVIEFSWISFVHETSDVSIIYTRKVV